MMLDPRDGQRIEDKDSLYETQKVSVRGRYLAKDPREGSRT
jgi:hypothetical protein